MNDGRLFETEYIEELSDSETSISLYADFDSVGKRIDAFIAENTELTRSAAARLIVSGAVALVGCEGKPISKNYKLREGDALTLRLPEPEPCEALPENIPM